MVLLKEFFAKQFNYMNKLERNSNGMQWKTLLLKECNGKNVLLKESIGKYFYDWNTWENDFTYELLKKVLQ